MTLNEKLIGRIALLIKTGVHREIAAATAGVGAEEFEEWMERGERGGTGNGPPMALYRAVQQAEAECEAALVARIRDSATNGSWQAAAWLAERRFPAHYGKTRAKDDDESRPPADPFSELDNVTPIRSRGGAR